MSGIKKYGPSEKRMTVNDIVKVVTCAVYCHGNS